MDKKVQPRINAAVSCMSVIAGVAAWIGCYFIYTEYYNAIPVPFLVGIMCAALFFLLFITVWIGSVVSGAFDKNSVLYANAGRMLGYLLIGTLGVLLLSSLLEFLYELSPKHKEIEATSYIFILDESGSMSMNDPNGLRYQAIPEIMKEKNAGFPYMVYTFSDDTQIAREMGPLDDEYNEIPIKNDGETTIFGTVIKVLNDYKNRVWDGGANPKIIFLTDGAATDLSKDFLWFKGNMPEFTSALEEYSELGINISTVGLGSVDREVMRKMAETTGGVFVSIQNASDLGAAMKTAATSYSDRNLLSIRYMKHLDKIYGVVRILFLSIIGMVIGSLVLLAYMEDTSIPIIIVSSAVSALAGSVLLELGLKIGIPQGGLWCCLWILFSLTLGYIYPKIENSRLLSWNEGCRMAPMAYRTLKMKRTK